MKNVSLENALHSLMEIKWILKTHIMQVKIQKVLTSFYPYFLSREISITLQPVVLLLLLLPLLGSFYKEILASGQGFHK